MALCRRRFGFYGLFGLRTGRRCLRRLGARYGHEGGACGFEVPAVLVNLRLAYPEALGDGAWVLRREKGRVDLGSEGVAGDVAVAGAHKVFSLRHWPAWTCARTSAAL
jgi:hypothetical protein